MPSVEELFALRKVARGSECSMITIPGFATLSEADQRALCAKIVYEFRYHQLTKLVPLTRRSTLERADLDENEASSEQDATPLDLDLLDSKLREIVTDSDYDSTPPPDPVANAARDRKLEEQSRKDLLSSGCPPCYPPGLEFSKQNVPENYEVLGFWWFTSYGSEGIVLTSQYSDWKDFRYYQKSTRKDCMKHGTFLKYVDRVRDRRRRQGLEGDACLLPDFSKQNQLENWIEFQFHHLDRHDYDEMQVKNWKEKLVAALEEFDTSGPSDAHSVDYYQSLVKYLESLLQEHDKLLYWIEQERRAMVAEKAATIRITGDPDRPRDMPTSPSPSQKRTQKPRLPLRPVRVAIFKKPLQKKTRLQSSKRNAWQSAKSTTAASKAVYDSNRISHLRDESVRFDSDSTLLPRPPSAAGAKVAHAQEQAICQGRRQAEIAADGPVQSSKETTTVLVESNEDTQWTED